MILERKEVNTLII